MSGEMGAVKCGHWQHRRGLRQGMRCIRDYGHEGTHLHSEPGGWSVYCGCGWRTDGATGSVLARRQDHEESTGHTAGRLVALTG